MNTIVKKEIQINTNDNRDVADDFPIDYESGLKVKYT